MSKKTKKNTLKAKRRTRLYRTLFLFSVILFLILAYTLCLNPQKKYDAALAELEGENYTGAAEGFGALGSYKDSEELHSYADCIVCFQGGRLNEGYESYLLLTDEDKQKVHGVIGEFQKLGDRAVNEGNYDAAFSYYSFDKEDPVSDEKAYALKAYLTAGQLYEEGSYAEARETAKLVNTAYIPSFDSASFINNCFAAEYEIYDAVADTDVNKAVKLMETISEYPRAATFLKDLKDAYEAAFAEMNAGNYDNARGLFEKLNSYKDSSSMIFTCKVLAVNAKAVAGETEQAVAEIKLLGEEALDIIPMDSPLWDAMGGDWSVGTIVYYGVYNGKHIKWCVLSNKNGVCTIASASPLMNVPFDAENPAAKWNTSTLRTLVTGELTEAFRSSGQKVLSKDLRLPYANEYNLLLGGSDSYSGYSFWMTDSGMPVLYDAGKTTRSMTVTDAQGLILLAEVKNA